jgi:hypothetical protein
MSWAEDEGIDGYVDDSMYDDSMYPEGWNNYAVWVDKDWNQTPITMLDTNHIKNILRGFKNGKSFFGQDCKSDVLEKILRQRAQGNDLVAMDFEPSTNVANPPKGAQPKQGDNLNGGTK